MFVRNNRSPVFDPEVTLSGSSVPFKCTINHLGVIMDSRRQSETSVEARVRKFFDGVNAVLGRIGGVCASQKVWMEIVDRQLFPIMAYGCHLWELERTDVKMMINMALRKGVRRGLGMRRNESICDRFGGKFQESVERMKKLKESFLQRAFYSLNGLVRGLLILMNDKKLHLGMS